MQTHASTRLLRYPAAFSAHTVAMSDAPEPRRERLEGGPSQLGALLLVRLAAGAQHPLTTMP